MLINTGQQFNAHAAAELEAKFMQQKIKLKPSQIKQKLNFQVKSASCVLLQCNHNMTAKLKKTYTP